MVSITYGHGFCDDGTSTTGWALTLGGATGTHTIDNNDYHKINITAAVGTVYIAYPDIAGASNLSLSATIYKKILGRCKTSNANIKAQVAIYYSDTYVQVVYASASPTTWAVFSADTLTTHGTIDHVILYANDAIGTVYYDFVLICQNLFAFPNTQNIRVPLNLVQDVTVPISGRSGADFQDLGTGNLVVGVDCDLDVPGEAKDASGYCGDWKRPQGLDSSTGLCYVKTDYIKGQVFLDILQNHGIDELWQWLDLEDPPMQFKARILPSSDLTFGNNAHTAHLEFEEVRVGSASSESEVERWGLNV